MCDALGVTAGAHAGAIDDCRDVVFSPVIVLVESDDQQAAMRLRPFGVGAEMGLKPSVASPLMIQSGHRLQLNQQRLNSLPSPQDLPQEPAISWEAVTSNHDNFDTATAQDANAKGKL
jgi:hypothetical protein